MSFRVRNWTKYQHYKDRNPPWIKLHVEILSSEDWVTLDDASKLLAVVCMVIAAKGDGIVPDNPAYIQRVAYLSKCPDLKPLVACGFLEPQADASECNHPLATARPEKEAYSTETEKETITSDPQADADISETVQPQSVRKKRAPYPEPFEVFWREYPTDPLMSKKKAFEQWRRLSPEDQEAARAAIPAFKAHCSKNTTYRPVHAERFISQRRFDGLNDAPKNGAAVDPELTRIQDREEAKYRALMENAA